jgi:hypothetical protein
MSWEERMAAQAAARAAAPPEPGGACEIGDPDMPPGHIGHHVHVGINYEACSCGADLGVWSVAINGDLPGQWQSPSCSVCGAEGVVARDHG